MLASKQMSCGKGWRESGVNVGKQPWREEGCSEWRWATDKVRERVERE